MFSNFKTLYRSYLLFFCICAVLICIASAAYFLYIEIYTALAHFNTLHTPQATMHRRISPTAHTCACRYAQYLYFAKRGPSMFLEKPVTTIAEMAQN